MRNKKYITYYFFYIIIYTQVYIAESSEYKCLSINQKSDKDMMNVILIIGKLFDIM